jgi:nucleoid-associated protein YgaU
VHLRAVPRRNRGSSKEIRLRSGTYPTILRSWNFVQLTFDVRHASRNAGRAQALLACADCAVRTAKSMEFSMRHTVLFPALGLALLAGTSLAQAQAVETVVTPAAAPTVIAQDPVVVPSVVVSEPAPVVETVPVQTTETVRTVRSTTRPVRRIARAHRAAPRAAATETTTTVTESIGPAPVPPAVAAINQPTYTEVVRAPAAYPAPLYDVVPAAAPPPAVVAQPLTPAYRYVYQPDRILVIDANTGVAVQAIPR